MGGIVLQDVNVDLGGKRVLSDLSVHLTEARIGLLGRNGSGKSTLLRLMAGLIAPSSGTVRVAGLDPARERKAMLGKIGILFQNPDHQILFPTVIEELSFGLQQMDLVEGHSQVGVDAFGAGQRIVAGHRGGGCNRRLGSHAWPGDVAESGLMMDGTRMNSGSITARIAAFAGDRHLQIPASALAVTCQPMGRAATVSARSQMASRAAA